MFSLWPLLLYCRLSDHAGTLTVPQQHPSIAASHFFLFADPLFWSQHAVLEEDTVYVTATSCMDAAVKALP